jgi:superfamily II DNA or RNA helicase
MATGGGKTVILSEISRLALTKHNKVTIITPRRKLVFQIEATLSKHGITSAVLMADVNYHHALVTVASIDTIVSRFKEHDLPKANLVIIDEAHLFMSEERLAVLNRYADTGATVLGLTATPALSNGSGLGMFFDSLSVSWTIEQLIQGGYLTPPKYYAPSKPDLSQVNTTPKTGDYNQRKLAEVMDKPKLIGDIVDNWLKIAPWKPTVVFCTNKKHSRHVCAEFLRRGISAEHMDANTPDDEREATFARIESGETVVLTNVYLASYGLDLPCLECAVIARPTKSIVLYMQTVGRVLRTFKGKNFGIVIDHSGCVDEHGFVENISGWSLDVKGKIGDKVKQIRGEGGEPKEITCVDCLSVFSGARMCPNCGHEMIPLTEAIPHYEADLVEVKTPAWIASKRWNKRTSWSEKIEFFAQLLGHEKEKKYKKGWAANQYRERSGVWPNDSRLKNQAPRVPTAILTGWLQSQKIKYWNRREK